MNLIGNFFVIIISLSMYFTTFNEMKGACPDASYSVRFVTIMVHDCYYEVEVCFKCVGVDPKGHVNVISFRKINDNCVQTWNTQQVFEGICQIIYEYNFLKTFICVSDQIVPCAPSDEGIRYEFFREMCWMKKLLANGTILYSTCNLSNTYCLEAWKMCFDPTLPFPHIKYTLLYGPSISGQYEELCEGVDEPEDPTIPDVYSTCFELHTPCNP